jgi:hypothetical protein
MQKARSRKLKTLVATLAVAALTAPVATGAQVDARHQALLDKAPKVQVDARHQSLLMPRESHPLHIGSAAPVHVSDGQDWGNAAIGAGALLGVLLVGAGGALIGRRKLASA